MQHPFRILFPMLLVITGIVLYSCGHDSDMDDIDDFRGEIISYTLLHDYTSAQSDSVMAAYDPTLLTYANDYEIQIYRVIYKTIDAFGNETQASGAVIVPMDNSTYFPLCEYEHGTVTMRYDVPSYESGELLIGIVYAVGGYISIMPDYIGMGDSPGRHLYCHAKTEATASIDLLRAAKTLCDEKDIRVGSQLFIFGYSQGGHAAMATTREIQLNYSNEFVITASAPMSGPYDIDGAQTDLVISDEPYAAPFYLPYLMFAYNDIYKMYPNYSDYLIAPYDSILPPLFDGNHEGWEIDAVMPDVPKLIIKPDVLNDFINNPENPFRIALKDNDLTDWVPTVPITMYYCTADELVSYQNALNAQALFVANGSTTTAIYQPSASASHTDCAEPCLIFSRIWFDTLKQ